MVQTSYEHPEVASKVSLNFQGIYNWLSQLLFCEYLSLSDPQFWASSNLDYLQTETHKPLSFLTVVQPPTYLRANAGERAAFCLSSLDLYTDLLYIELYSWIIKVDYRSGSKVHSAVSTSAFSLTLLTSSEASVITSLFPPPSLHPHSDCQPKLSFLCSSTLCSSKI